jgi:acetyltransferase
MALVADRQHPETGEHQILGVARLSKLVGRNEAEFSMLVMDQFQGRGLGTELLRQLLQVGKDEQLNRVGADILFDNLAMQKVCKKLGFNLVRSQAEQLMKAEIQL